MREGTLDARDIPGAPAIALMTSTRAASIRQELIDVQGGDAPGDDGHPSIDLGTTPAARVARRQLVLTVQVRPIFLGRGPHPG